MTNCHRISSHIAEVLTLNGWVQPQLSTADIDKSPGSCESGSWLCSRCIPATYPGVLQAVRKERATARPPVDNNQDHTQTGTTWNSEVGHLILTDLTQGLVNTSTLHLSLDWGDLNYAEKFVCVLVCFPPANNNNKKLNKKRGLCKERWIVWLITCFVQGPSLDATAG